MTKPKVRPFTCSNCNQPIGKTGVLMPSGDPKKRQMCLGCARKIFLESELKPPFEWIDEAAREVLMKGTMTKQPKPRAEGSEKLARILERWFRPTGRAKSLMVLHRDLSDLFVESLSRREREVREVLTEKLTVIRNYQNPYEFHEERVIWKRALDQAIEAVKMKQS